MATHVPQVVVRHARIADKDEIQFGGPGAGCAEHGRERPVQFRPAEREPPAQSAAGKVEPESAGTGGRIGLLLRKTFELAHGRFPTGFMDSGPLLTGFGGPGTTG